ncbi:MAG: amino acid-binding protein [Gammaproteobacteria bacterium]|uniref:Amino acid-binding protein n=1 Tax=Candidatus Thiopontia autotrophica TaxID=2841688 RepID=A0A8J6P6C9_9GAMM|nr:amino acid-binding protein [Candidatus Thiopontia autotrophica]
MKNWYMMALVGKDQPGIVAQITEALFKAGGSLGETSMMRLGSNFTIMMMVEMDGDEKQLCQTVHPVTEELGLHLHVDKIEPGLHQHSIPDLRVVVYGADRPGIVAQVTGVLAESGFDITDLDSQVGGAAEKPIYILMIEGIAGAGVDAVHRALEPLSESIDFRVEEIETLIG